MTGDDTGCTVIHVDMDAFYAAVATRDRPDLHGAPVIIGGGSRGVVLSASYAAREYGVDSGMPMTRARRLCPAAVVIPPDFSSFSAVSAALMEIFRSVTPIVEPLSMDEAFLDVSGSLRRFRTPTAVGEFLRARIADEQRIPCSVGIAANASLAKMASRQAKPDGLLVVPVSEVTAFLHPQDVQALWGVGDKTAAVLHRLGLRTIGDLAHIPLPLLQRALGSATAARLHALSWGNDDRRVTARRAFDEPDSSMGADETLGRDTDDPLLIQRELLRLAAKVTARMRAAGVCGRTVTVRIRFSDFTMITRSRTLRHPTAATPEIYATAVDLFTRLGLQRARIRLVGVRVEGLLDANTTPRQLRLGERCRSWEDAERAVDQAVSRFGRTAVRPATLLR